MMGRACGQRLIGEVRLAQCVRTITTQEGLDPAIDPLDLIETGLRDFAGGRFPPGDAGGEFGNGQSMGHNSDSKRARRGDRDHRAAIAEEAGSIAGRRAAERLANPESIRTANVNGIVNGIVMKS